VKARLGYSPDDADAFVLTFAQPVSGRRAGDSRGRIEHEYDPLEEYASS
jgi:hypothetical protein